MQRIPIHCHKIKGLEKITCDIPLNSKSSSTVLAVIIIPKKRCIKPTKGKPKRFMSIVRVFGKALHIPNLEKKKLKEYLKLWKDFCFSVQNKCPVEFSYT